MMDFLALLKQGEIEQVYDEFQQLDKEKQLDFFEQVARELKNNNKTSLHITPLTMSVLRRHLKPGKTYDDFLKAWVPDAPQDKDVIMYYDIPVQVINARNLNKPSEVISVGLVAADEKLLMKKAAQFKEADALRRERIAQVTQDSSIDLYAVLDIKTLGK